MKVSSLKHSTAFSVALQKICCSHIYSPMHMQVFTFYMYRMYLHCLHSGSVCFLFGALYYINHILHNRKQKAQKAKHNTKPHLICMYACMYFYVVNKVRLFTYIFLYLNAKQQWRFLNAIMKNICKIGANSCLCYILCCRASKEKRKHFFL